MRTCVLIFILSFLVQACGGTDAGNPGRVRLSMQVASSSASPAALRGLSDGTSSLSVGDFNVSVARVSIGRVVLRPFDTCESEAEEEDAEDEAEAFLVDILSGGTLASFVPQTDRYCRLRIDFKKYEGAGEMNDISIYVEGRLADSTPVEIRVKYEEEFEIRNESQGFVLNPGQSLIVGLDIDQWFQGVDWEAAVETGGVILIDEDHNEDLFVDVYNAIRSSARLVEDEDDDGEIDEDEFEEEDDLGE